MANLDLDGFMAGLVRRNPGETEFHQAVREVVGSLIPFLSDHPKYAGGAILQRMTEPDRIIIFRVCWLDDENHIRTNRSYRVQFNNAIALAQTFPISRFLERIIINIGQSVRT